MSWLMTHTKNNTILHQKNNMKKFAYWLNEVIGKQNPRTQPVIFHCDGCRKNKPIEQLNAEKNKRGILKLCDNCFTK